MPVTMEPDYFLLRFRKTGGEDGRGGFIRGRFPVGKELGNFSNELATRFLARAESNFPASLFGIDLHRLNFRREKCPLKKLQGDLAARIGEQTLALELNAILIGKGNDDIRRRLFAFAYAIAFTVSIRGGPGGQRFYGNLVSRLGPRRTTAEAGRGNSRHTNQEGDFVEAVLYRLPASGRW